MDVLRIRAAGPVTSFRYPFFVQGVQPTYLLPPPATLYGHVQSALGEPPGPFRLAFHFSHAGRFADYEHTHLFGREPKLSPFTRELLFQPRLTLYLDRPDWLPAFHAPHYPVVLGRSQDLMQYTDVQVVNLAQAAAAYSEGTLIPLEEAVSIGAEAFTALRMPAYIDPSRRPVWETYAQIEQRQPVAGPAAVDSESPLWRGLYRAVYWLTFPAYSYA
jgi:CRISPR-associated protein Cas5t